MANKHEVHPSLKARDDSVLPLRGISSPRQKRGKLPWVLVLFLATLCFLLPSLRRHAVVWSPSPSSSNGISGKPTVITTNLAGNGRTNDVLWDEYSLVLKGQRIFIHSGEFHPFRLPVPGLWLDVLQKIKAAGFNAISIYTHMGLINPSPGVIDFNDYRALAPLYEAAKQAGIWIVLRPGPYINAETTAGGIAHWVTSQVASELRTNATDWKEAWQDYIQGIIAETEPYQINRGGPVIAIQLDNEYSQLPLPHAEYFVHLQNAFYNSSIVVPLTANDADAARNWISGTGSVDIYGLDSYPQKFDCSNPTTWNPVDTSYYTYHMSANPDQPLYFPEAGAFDAWGPTAPGYDQCRVLTGEDFENIFNLHLWAANSKLINYYMLYGGTSWGGLPFPGVYTSYDYGSAIAENRELTNKYPELKRQGLFLRSSPEFYKTDVVGDSRNGAVNVTNDSAFIAVLTNPDTNTSFFIARQIDSTSTATINFKLNVVTSGGSFQIPRVASAITLNGRQSKVIVTDYSFGSSKVLYSTAQILYAGRIGSRDVLFLYGNPNQEHETALSLKGVPRLQAHSPLLSYTSVEGIGIPTVTFLSGIQGLVTVWDSSEQLILYSDSVTAGTFWSPEIPTNPSDDFANYWQYGTNTSVLIGGPYLVRNATISGSTLAIRGDLQDSVRLTVIAPDTVHAVTWNGMPITADLAAATITYQGGFSALISPSVSAAAIVVPRLTNWRYANSLPEIESDFSDAKWTIADHTHTNIPFKPHYGDGRVLYGCDYEYCENIVLWRGHFIATEDSKSVNLSINGGEAFAASIWVNDVFLNTSYGNSTNNRNIKEETDDEFYFPPGSLRYNEDNVITILQDNMGLNENGATVDEEKSPRGVRGFKLNTGNFNEWKVQGKVGGYSNYPDKVRGVLNEGGLYGERLGWHLPGYDTSSWEMRDLSEGLPNATAGVGFFVTTFDLHIADYLDVPMSFTFDHSFQPYRAQLYVNGWMMGKRVANLGPQYKFPVQQGILNYDGVNTVSVALWAMEHAYVSPTLELTIDGVYEGGVGGIYPNNPSWSAAGRE